MPLQEGSSETAISNNIAELRHAGHPEKQAIAIAEREAGTARKDEASRGDCAGILFRVREKGPLFLLLQRKDTGEWAQPGGHLEAGETPEGAAVRECEEEIGGCPDGIRWAVRRNSIPKGKGIFTCFLQDVAQPFEPELNDEHTNWGWFSPDALPQPMHRKVSETIERVTGNELDIAKRMAAGELLSPQRYENMWLFDIRITGTGTSYRGSIGEYVYRPPEKVLTDEYVQRCNGLALIFMHPKKKDPDEEKKNPQVILDTENFRERSIGSVVLPYIKGQEIRGIAKVFDDDAALLMRTTHTSTSPAVVFRDAGSTETLKLDDGSTVLVEGDPSLIDHIAVCEDGVWDKGEGPTGVNIEGDSIVDQENEAVPAWADALIKRCDALEARLEGKHEERKDGEDKEERREAAVVGAEEHKEERKDEEHKDSEVKAEGDGKAEEKEEHKAAEALKEAEKDGEKERRAEEHADAQRREAGLQAKIHAMEARLAELTKPRTNADRDELSRVQRRAESVAMAFGDSNAISPPLYDESPIAYRKRCAAAFQKHSPKASKIDLKKADEATFAVMEELIYADAQAAARTPAALPKGRLQASTDTSTGHRITTYTGDPEACWGPFKHRGFMKKISAANQRAN